MKKTIIQTLIVICFNSAAWAAGGAVSAEVHINTPAEIREAERRSEARDQAAREDAAKAEAQYQREAEDRAQARAAREAEHPSSVTVRIPIQSDAELAERRARLLDSLRRHREE